MSTEEAVQIEQAISALEEKFLAKLAKWGISIIASLLTITILAVSHWHTLAFRVEKLEIWKSERVKPIETYHQERLEDGERFARIEAKLTHIAERLDELRGRQKQ